MAKKDTTKQDIRILLLKNSQIVPSSYTGPYGKVSKEDSMKAAIAARRTTFATKKD